MYYILQQPQQAKILGLVFKKTGCLLRIEFLGCRASRFVLSSCDAGDGAAGLKPQALDGRPYRGFHCSGRRAMAP